MSDTVQIDDDEDNQVDKNAEPQLNSADPTERKLARRLRIQRRLEASKKPKKTEPEDDLLNEDKNAVDTQIEKSEDMLLALYKDGQELVTNICVANDAREKQHSAENLLRSRIRRGKLEEEAENSIKQLNEISGYWDRIALNHDVLHLHEDIQKQKVRCENLVKDKNLLIKVLDDELSSVDECYVKNLKKQSEEIGLCAQRIDSLVDAMRRAYKLELSLLEMAIEKDRKDMTEEYNQRWMLLYKQQDESANEKMRECFERVAQQQKDVYDTHIEFAEKFRRVKVALENDIQLLQQEVEQIQAICLLNSEKLDYNFHVLKKREEENTILKSQQKRRITKLLDSISKLKLNIKETTHKTKVETEHLTEEVLGLHKNIMDIEDKSMLFSELNDKRYHDVWKMNEKTVLNLLNKVLDADRVITEQQLCMDWIKPEIPFLKSDDKGLKEKTDIPIAGAKEESKMSLNFKKRKLLCHLLQKLADNSSFLLEDRLKTLLAPYTSQESTLVCIDNIFMALGISSLSDIGILLEVFMPYLECPICKEAQLVINAESTAEITYKEDTGESINSDKKGDEKKRRDKQGTSIKERQIRSNERDHAVDSNTEEASISFKKKDHDSQDGDGHIINNDLNEEETQEVDLVHHVKNSLSCPNLHPLQMSSTYVLRALRDFAHHIHHSHYRSTNESASSRIEKKSSASRMMTKDDVEDYWAQFLRVFTEPKAKLWNALLDGLQKYYIILQERHKLVEETSKLRQQNSELRQLLQSYIISNKKFEQ